MYTVKQVSALTGVSEATLRVWERRYKVVEPSRSSSGYRQYDDEQVSVLRAMVALVSSGVPASTAAETVRTSGTSGAGHDSVPDLPTLVGAAATADPQELDAVLERAFEGESFEAVVDAWLPSALRQLGEAWETGAISVAQEHFASAAVLRHLAAQFEQADPGDGVPVLVGLAQGGRHELMLLAFAVCLRRRGVNAIYLGADVPVEDWEGMAVLAGARAAVIGVHLEDEVEAAQSVVDRLSSLRPPVAVRVGGSLRHEIHHARPLEDAVSAAAGTLARELRAGAA